MEKKKYIAAHKGSLGTSKGERRKIGATDRHATEEIDIIAEYQRQRTYDQHRSDQKGYMSEI